MLIITGSVAYDYIMDFPGAFSDHILQDQIHNINLSFIVSNFERRRGGTAGNVSYSLGLLDTPHILFSYAGKDFNEYKTAFKKYKISTDYIHIDKNTYTATGFAMTDKANNQIWGFFYGAAERNPELRIIDVATKNDLVLIGPAGTKGPISFVKQCVKEQIPYMLDPGFNLTFISDDDLTYCITYCKYLIGNDYEINLIKKRAKNYDQIMKDKIVITTLGEKGATITQNGKEIFIQSAKPKKVVDPTGAGDSWRSGFLAGLTRGLDLETCGRMGAVTASFLVEQYGTQEHKFTKQQFTKRYRDTYNTEIEI